MPYIQYTQVGDLEDGESGWIYPWEVRLGEDGRLWVHPEAVVALVPFFDMNMFVKRMGSAFKVTYDIGDETALERWESTQGLLPVDVLPRVRIRW